MQVVEDLMEVGVAMVNALETEDNDRMEMIKRSMASGFIGIQYLPISDG